MRRKTTLATLAAICVALATAPSAQAKAAPYGGSGTQAGHPAVGVGFILNGKKCPRGPDCFKNAKLTEFLAVSYGFPICSEELLESAFEFHKAIKVKPNRTFKASGMIPDTAGGSSPGDIVTIEGKFGKKGRNAHGTFTVDRGGCLTGKVPFTVAPE